MPTEPCGSVSMSRTFRPWSAQSLAKVVAVVVLATPPRWLEMTSLITVPLRDHLPDAFHILRRPPPVPISLVAFRLLDPLSPQPVHERPFGNPKDVGDFLGPHVEFWSSFHGVTHIADASGHTGGLSMQK